MNTEHFSEQSFRSQVRVLVMMAATALGLYFCYRMALPFVPALTWAMTLAVLFMPVYRWLKSKVKRASLAAALLVLAIGLVVIVPATFVGQRVVSEAAAGADAISARVEAGEWQRFLDDHPRVAPIAQRIGRRIDLPGTISAIATSLTNAAGAFITGSVRQAVDLLLTFYLLFYFLRDERAALSLLRFLSPLPKKEMDTLLSRLGDTVYATMYGTLTVAAAQGSLGGLMFWWLGLPAPLLWGLVMAVLAVVPVMGAFCRVDSGRLSWRSKAAG